MGRVKANVCDVLLANSRVSGSCVLLVQITPTSKQRPDCVSGKVVVVIWTERYSWKLVRCQVRRPWPLFQDHRS